MSYEREAESIEALVTASYESISYADPKDIDWDRVRSHMAPGAMMIRVTEAAVERMTTDSWIDGFRAMIDDGTLPTFWEGEVASHVDRFGDIVQVFSTYEARPTEEDPRILWRGINSFQLYWRDGRWWISSILWTRETEAKRVPVEYEGH